MRGPPATRQAAWCRWPMAGWSPWHCGPRRWVTTARAPASSSARGSRLGHAGLPSSTASACNGRAGWRCCGHQADLQLTRSGQGARTGRGRPRRPVMPSPRWCWARGPARNARPMRRLRRPTSRWMTRRQRDNACTSRMIVHDVWRQFECTQTVFVGYIRLRGDFNKRKRRFGIELPDGEIVRRHGQPSERQHVSPGLFDVPGLLPIDLVHQILFIDFLTNMSPFGVP